LQLPQQQQVFQRQAIPFCAQLAQLGLNLTDIGLVRVPGLQQAVEALLLVGNLPVQAGQAAAELPIHFLGQLEVGQQSQAIPMDAQVGQGGEGRIQLLKEGEIGKRR
jgi:hypothetical protein